MLANLGYSSLILLLVAAICFSKKPLYVFCICSSSLIILGIAYLQNNFSLEIVYLHSNSKLPTLYKISGIWSNAEGSLLFWVWILSLYNFVYKIITPNYLAHKYTTIQIQTLLISCFTILLIIIYNPFKALKIIPLEGRGLNPVLQDIALSIHPPFLYLGYLGFSILYSLSLAILLQPSVKSYHLNEIKKWNALSWSCLTLGITLGAWWAYRELGWGGFWFWDPVETISILPWLASTVLLHVIKLRPPNIKIILLLALLPFPLIMYGTFLVRAGLLESVHAFTASIDKGLCLLILFIIVFLVAIGVFLLNYSKCTSTTLNSHYVNLKNKSIGISSIALLLFLITLLIAITYPLINSLININTVSISSDYYNKFLTYLTIFCLCISLLTYTLGFPETNYLQVLLKYNIPLLLASIITLYTYTYSHKLDFLSLIFLCTLHITALLQRIINNNLKISLTYLAMFFGHFGILILIFGVILTSNLTQSMDKYIHLGETIHLADYKIYLKELIFKTDPNYNAIQGVFSINNAFYLYPETRLYTLTNTGNAEAAILHRYFADIYIVISELNPTKGIGVQIYYRPFISWIWLGGILTAVSGVIICIIRNKKNTYTHLPTVSTS